MVGNLKNRNIKSNGSNGIKAWEGRFSNMRSVMLLRRTDPMEILLFSV